MLVHIAAALGNQEAQIELAVMYETGTVENPFDGLNSLNVLHRSADGINLNWLDDLLNPGQQWVTAEGLILSVGGRRTDDAAEAVDGILRIDRGDSIYQDSEGKWWQSIGNGLRIPDPNHPSHGPELIEIPTVGEVELSRNVFGNGRCRDFTEALSEHLKTNNIPHMVLQVKSNTPI